MRLSDIGNSCLGWVAPLSPLPGGTAPSCGSPIRSGERWSERLRLSTRSQVGGPPFPSGFGTSPWLTPPRCSRSRSPAAGSATSPAASRIGSGGGSPTRSARRRSGAGADGERLSRGTPLPLPQRVPVDIHRLPVAEGLVRALFVEEAEVPADALPRHGHAVVRMEEDLLVLERAPEPLHEHVVETAAAAVHRDPDPAGLEDL